MGNKKAKNLQPAVKKVVEIKGSHYLCIPKKFVDHYGIRPGDSIVLIPKAEMISILPMKGD